MQYAKLIFIFALATAIILPPNLVWASETDGTIDSTYKYAWSENIAWINFGTTGGNVHVTDSGLTGYAWSSNYGWINLNPPGSRVINNGEGTLSGAAWGENTGWIEFTGVTIDSSGYFSGYASGTVTGQISFNCSNTDSCDSSDFKIRTGWRPQSVRPPSGGGGGGGGGGGSSSSSSLNILYILPSSIRNDRENIIIIIGQNITFGRFKLQNTNNIIELASFSQINNNEIRVVVPANIPVGIYDLHHLLGSSWKILKNALTVVGKFDLLPITEFFHTPFRYQWLSQSGILSADGTAHEIYVRAGDTISMSLTIKNRSIDRKALVMYGIPPGGNLLPEVAPYRGAHELRVGVKDDEILFWVDSSSFYMNPDGDNNRFAVYDGSDANPNDTLTFTWSLKISDTATQGTYNLYTGVVREFDAWARQVTSAGVLLPSEDIFWKIIVE